MGIEEKTQEGILIEDIDMSTYISIREHEDDLNKYMADTYYPYEGGIRKIGE